MNVPYKYCTYNHNWAVDSWKEKWTILILLKKKKLIVFAREYDVGMNSFTIWLHYIKMKS